MEPPTDALQANAYAISYRLLGDRPAARAAAGVAVVRARADGVLAGERWLPGLAVEVVRQSVSIAGQGRRGEVADESLRAALRRRLASARPDEQAAASLHHLAGYPIADVAAAMGRPVDEVTRLAGALAPPPGVSYRGLGDAELIGATGGPDRRRGFRRPAVHWTTIAVVVVAAALVVAVGRSVGTRPTLGRVSPPASGVHVGADVAALASKGCGRGAAAGTFQGTVAADGAERTYRLAVPPSTAPPTGPPGGTGDGPSGGSGEVPRGLLVALPGYGQTADELLAVSGLEQQGTAQGFVVATVQPQPPATELSAVSSRPDDVGHVRTVIDDVVGRECIDLHRIHLVGFGPGGQVAGAAACAEPGVVASAALVDGALVPSDCRLDPPVSLLELWNAGDDVLPPAGGYGPALAQVVGTSPTRVRPTAEPAEALLDRWGDLIGAGPRAVADDADGTTTIQRSDTPSGASVQLVTLPGGGHDWPAGATARVLAFVRDHARST